MQDEVKDIPNPVEGCPGCRGTAGIYGCPFHSPNGYIRIRDFEAPPEPFTQIFIRCPHCGQNMQFDGKKLNG